MALIGATSPSRQRRSTSRGVLMLIIRAMLPRRQGTEPEYWRARWRRRDPRDRNAESIGIAPRVSLVHKVSSALDLAWAPTSPLVLRARRPDSAQAPDR